MTAESRRLTILFYNKFFQTDPAIDPPAECVNTCELTSDRARFDQADAVVFHVPTMPTWSEVRKRPGQQWIAWSLESDELYPQLGMEHFMRRFDLTMLYRLNSDVPVLYIDPGIAEALRTPPKEKTEAAPVALFSTNTRERSGRSMYIREVMQHIEVASYGKWMANRVIEGPDLGRQTKLDTIARHKFTLAFENSVTWDYVSEKFFDALIAGSVPVYEGAPNIEEFAPGDRCYIRARDFETPGALAAYLRELDADPARYGEYLEWKLKPFRPRFSELVDSQRLDARCRLCRKLRCLRGE